MERDTLKPRYDDGFAQMFVGDAIDVLSQLPEKSVHCVVTSPPYFGLRSYLPAGHPDKAREGGTQETPEAYVEWLVQVFRTVWKVLRDDGTLWLNLGDSYNDSHRGVGGTKSKQPTNPGSFYTEAVRKVPGLKPKDLLMIPARVALALQADGWYLRSQIVWCKSNPMPESVTDRPTQATEMVYLFSKKPRYFYDNDAIREPLKPKTLTTFGGKGKAYGNDEGGFVKTDNWHSTVPERKPKLNPDGSHAGANAKNYWQISTRPYAGSHYAVFPEEIPRRAIKAGTSERGVCSECGAPYVRVVERTGETTADRARENGHADHANAYAGPQKQNLDFKGSHWKLPPRESRTIGFNPTCSHDAEIQPAVVLDPFSGSGTTGLVARKLGRKSILIDLDERNVKLLEERLVQGVLL